jgi:hypothetical protein
MTTAAKLAANRHNALRSTGPRTPAGKDASSSNALQHGLLSREVLLQDESVDDLVAFRRRLLDELRPVGELEELLSDRVVTSAWRLRRILKVETEVFAAERRGFPRHDNPIFDGMEQTRTDLGVGHAFLGEGGENFVKLSRYEAGIERALFRALHELQRLQAARAGEPVPLPVAVDVDVSLQGSTDPERQEEPGEDS